MDKTEILVTEWRDIRDSLRAFGNKRFAQLTVFMAATGFMFDAFLKQTELAPRLALAIVGIVVGVLFLIMEISAVRYWDKFAARAKKIEETVSELELMTKWRPDERLFSGTHATYTIYVAACLLWLSTFYWN